MDIVVVDAVEDIDTLTAAHGIEVIAHDRDYHGLPADPIEELRPVLKDAPKAGEHHMVRLGRVDGEPVGMFHLRMPTLDNLSSINVQLVVHPDQRRKGYGRQLLDAALGEAARLGRTRVFLTAGSPLGSIEGPAASMLRAVGAKPALADVRRLLDVAAATPAARPECPAQGYRVVRWVDRAPEEFLDDLARLTVGMSTDPPLGELDYEPEVWDAHRYREREQLSLDQQRIRFATGVVHEESGTMVAMTDLGVSALRHEVAYQWDTIVSKEHRGHRLGLTIKAWNLEQVIERLPEVRYVNTWNAAENAHMIAINDALGFRPVDSWTEWQLDR